VLTCAPVSSDTDDAELLACWRRGDRDAAGQLMERNFPRIKAFFARKTSDRDLVQELTQRTFERCLHKVHTFEQRSNFSSFIYGIARYILLEHYRERRRTEQHDPIEDTPVVDLDPSPFAIIERNSERKLIIHVLRRLPLDLQILVELYFFENLSARQVAEVLELPEGTVRGRIRACRQQVEQHVRDLAESPEQLESTLTTVSRWAQQVREQV
jgi:RNA polymerase sigma factor (sigma-70 family)